MLAEIASGNFDAADAFFLIATILAVLAAVAYALASRPTPSRVLVWAPVLLSLSVACVAFAWLQL
jgi:Mn2+/Fe2+ NRAMP family transporter